VHGELRRLEQMNGRADLFHQMAQAVVDGNREKCVALAQQAINEEVDPTEAIQQGYAAGMEIVGEKFAKLEYYLPDVIRCAEAAEGGFEVLQDYLMELGEGSSSGTVVLGTIKGDMHDLGKNIVGTMLQAAGFEVHDIGCDVPIRAFVDEAQEVEADIIGVSAILTTTMSYMPDLLRLLDDMGVRADYKVMVGGAPVTPSYADEIGADGYGETAADAVKTAKRIMQEKE
jgi:corrinoid protein of di/trimethylamine methyltransferase